MQYFNEEVELFDGVQVFMSSLLSQSKATHFLYSIHTSDKPVVVSVRSASDSIYRMVGRLMEWNDYFKESNDAIYPRFDDSTDLIAETADRGSTLL